MLRNLALHAALALIGAALAVTGAWAMREESAAYLAGGPSSIARAAAWTTQPVPPGLSIFTQKLTMLDCDNALSAMGSLEMRYLDAQRSAAIGPACLALADELVADAPTFSYAWYVGARASTLAGDWTGFNDRLLRSQLSGPNEQWIAERRAALAEDNLARLSDLARSAHDDDLRMLVRSDRGIATIATRYVSDAAFRDRITAIVETMTPPDQQRFIGSVRNALSRSR
jgi:hypothetical protein